MSVLAGIVNLDSRRPVNQEDIDTMLAAAAPVAGCETQSVVLPRLGIAVGKLCHGGDVMESANLNGPGPRVLMLGEIYNDPVPIGKSHAERILDMYREKGSPGFARDLNGTFAIALIDEAAGTVILATDHNNSVHVHYMIHNGTLYFATEIKAIMALKHLPCELDYGQALTMLTSNMLMNLQTLVKDVSTLDGAAIWRIADGRIEKEKYWKYAIEDSPRDMGLDYYVDQAIGLIGQSVTRMTRSGHPIALMTGGVDTRTIVSFAPDRSQLYGITLTGVGDENRNPLGDVALARRVAHKLGIRHSVVQWHPEHVLEAIQNSVYGSDGATCLLLEENVFDEVQRIGQSNFATAGDECMSASGGGISESHVLECLGIRPLRLVPSLFPYLRADKLARFQELTEVIYRRRLEGLSGRPPNNQLDELEHYQRVFHFGNTRRHLHVRHGILTRRPLLDRDYLNLLRAIPWYRRVGRKVVLAAIKKAYPDMASLPYARTREQVDLGLLIAHLDKKGGKASSFLFDDNPLMEEIFDVKALRNLLGKLVAIDPANTKKVPFRPAMLVPPLVRFKLAALARKYLGLHSKTLVSPSALLLQVAKVASALRHVAHRCAKPKKIWID